MKCHLSARRKISTSKTKSINKNFDRISEKFSLLFLLVCLCLAAYSPVSHQRFSYSHIGVCVFVSLFFFYCFNALRHVGLISATTQSPTTPHTFPNSHYFVSPCFSLRWNHKFVRHLYEMSVFLHRLNGARVYLSMCVMCK